MATIENLPEEVITHILSFLCAPDIKDASLVNKRWYNASLDPILQSNLVISLTSDSESWDPRRFVNVEIGPSTSESWLAKLMTSKLTLHNIKSISFRGSSIDESLCVNLLKACKNLEEIDLSCCNHVFMSGNFMSSDKEALKKSLTNVNDLCLSSIRYLSNKTFTNVVSACGNLTTLTLASARLIFHESAYGGSSKAKDSTIITFQCLLQYIKSNATKLKTLNLCHTGISDDALESLSSVNGLKLSGLFLIQCREITDEGIIALCKNQKDLQALDINMCSNVGNRGIAAIGQYLRKLTVLKIPMCKLVNNGGVDSLKSIVTLQEVLFSELCYLTSDCLLRALQPSTQLQRINVAFCISLDDTFIVEMSEQFRGMTHLDLTAVPLTDDGLHAVCRNLTKLQYLKLSRCSKITDKGLLPEICSNDTTPIQSDENQDGNSKSRNTSQKFDNSDKSNSRKTPKTNQQFKPANCGDHETIPTINNLTILESDSKTGPSINNLKQLLLLDISYCRQITDASLSKLIQFNELRNLDLTGLTQITDESLEFIAANNPSLTLIKVSKCYPVTDCGIRALVSRLKRLSILEMSNLGLVTNESMKCVKRFCKRLCTLDVSCCSKITEEAVMQIRQSIPSLININMNFIG